MRDFDIVREALGELSTYGSHAQESPLDLPAVAALARIEAEYNKWQDLFADLVDENARLRCIEEAAQGYVLTVEHGLAVEQMAEALAALRTALEGGDPGA